MATRWSSEFTAAEHRDLQASAMAVDWTGVFVLLAGRRYLAIKNLDDSSDTLYKIPRHSKYEVGAAEWNPSSANKHLCAISSNQRVEILSWENTGDINQINTLRSHTRVVSDLNWHRFDANLLATCSIDTFIHVWDARDFRRPALSLSAVAGATQVKWNRLSRFLLATAHDGEIKLWDQRKGTAPVQYLTAHLAKIHGLDWSPVHENKIATSSQDCTVKFFDITNPRRAESTLTTNSPVWRARYTPFGQGLITVVVPQLRRGENSLLLWNISNQTSPVHTFVGHTDVVLEFEWRKLREDSPDYQLITWSKDQTLRIWRIEPFLQKLCGHELDGESNDGLDSPESESSSLDITSPDVATASVPTIPTNGSGNKSSETTHSNEAPSQMGTDTGDRDLSGDFILVDEITSSNECDTNEIPISTDNTFNTNNIQTIPKTLQQEFSLININIPNVKVEAMDALRRNCTVTATRDNHLLVLQVTFPPNYPYNAAPTFQFGPSTTVDTTITNKLLKVLKHTAQQRVKTNKSCLEPCLRQLVNTLDQLSLNDEFDKNLPRPSSSSFMESPSIYTNQDYQNFQDAYVPFPRTSGARFCNVGILVVFGRPHSSRRMSTRLDSPTPRSMSALGGSLGGPSALAFSHIYNPPTTDVSRSLSSFYFQEPLVNRNRRNPKTLREGMKTQIKKTPKAVVNIYDASSLFFIHRELGEKYIFDPYDLPNMCHRNSTLASSIGRRDLAQAWSLAALSAMPLCPGSPEYEEDIPWSFHPAGRAMIESLIFHFANLSDIQMAAMLCCTFGNRTENQEAFRQKQLSKSVNISSQTSGRWWLKPGGSPYHTIHPIDSSLEGWHYSTSMRKQNRSNSWSDSLDGISCANIVEHHEVDDPNSETFIRPYKILDEKYSTLYDTFKTIYADILHRWNLLDARVQVLKFMSIAPEPHRGVEFFTECLHCNKQVRGASCLFCKRLLFLCAICHISVRGSSNFCLICGHGGHAAHMKQWFEKEQVCPTGCGCQCLAESLSFLES